MKYSKEQIQEAVSNSTAWRGVIDFLNPNNKGHQGSEGHIKKQASKMGIDFSHFKGQGWNIGKTFPPRRAIEEYLTANGPFIKSSELKRKIINLGLKPRHCEMCKHDSWNGKPIHVELHHVNKNPKDNRLENLQILCSNCHSFTHGMVGHEPKAHKIPKERKESVKTYKVSAPLRECSCGTPLKRHQLKFCGYKCARVTSRKYERPSKEKLTELVSNLPMTKVAAEFGATDNLIRKWCKDYGIDFKFLSPSSHGKAKPKKIGRAFASKYIHVSYENSRNKWFAEIKGVRQRFNSELEAAQAVAKALGSETLIERTTNLPSLAQ